MKRSSALVIVIPLVVVFIVVGLVFVMRVKSKASEPVEVPTSLVVPKLKEDPAGKPTSGFSVTTGVASPVSDLEADLNGAEPTDDASDIESLQNEADAL